LDPELFEQIERKAKRLKKSINAHCVDVLGRNALNTVGITNDLLIKDLIEYFAPSLLGIVLFGSVARETANEVSDVDLLLVLDSSTPINRKLYRQWDEKFTGRKFGEMPNDVSPHFSHLPEDPSSAGSLWLEVAIEAKLLWSANNQLEDTLRLLRKQISEGCFVKAYSYGVPYWKKVS